MSGENIYNILPATSKSEGTAKKGPYTGTYQKRMQEPPKPVYSTFHQKGKEYDGSNVRFYKQRDAVIGKNVGETVDPSNFLKKDGGVKRNVAPVKHEKIYTKPPLPQDLTSNAKYVDGNADAPDENIIYEDENGNLFDCYGNPITEFDEDGKPIISSRGLPGGMNSKGNGEFGQGNVNFGEKDFVTSNIVEISNMVPKRKFNQPEYATDRKDFGKTPAYLNRVKGEIEEERNFVQSIEEQKRSRYNATLAQYVFQLDEAEKQELVRKLNENLQTKTAALNKMPFGKTTVQATKRRAELEKNLQDIEEALKKLNRKAIFVYKDDPVNVQWTKSAAMEAAREYASSQ